MRFASSASGSEPADEDGPTQPYRYVLTRPDPHPLPQKSHRGGGRTRSESFVMKILEPYLWRLGEMMAEQPKAPPGREPDIGLSKNPISEKNINRPISLTQAGIDKNLAHRATNLRVGPRKLCEI